MPLKEGSSREVVGQNIKTEVQSGKPQAQAVAIALKEAGLSNKDWERPIAPASYNDGAWSESEKRQGEAEKKYQQAMAEYHKNMNALEAGAAGRRKNNEEFNKAAAKAGMKTRLDEGPLAPEQVSGPDGGMDAKKPAREPDRAEVERIYQTEGYEAAKKAAEEMGILWHASAGRTANRDYSGDVASSMGGLPQTISHAEMAAFASNFNYNQKR